MSGGLDRLEDHVPALVRAPVAGDALGVSAGHHPVDVAAYRHVPIPMRKMVERADALLEQDHLWTPRPVGPTG